MAVESDEVSLLGTQPSGRVSEVRARVEGHRSQLWHRKLPPQHAGGAGAERPTVRPP